MLTTLDLDRKLLDAVGEETESGVVNATMTEYIRRKHVKDGFDRRSGLKLYQPS